MNLTGDRWIPVVLDEGTSQLVSLKEAFRRGEEIRDLVATPPQRIALTRLLVCIAQAALDGPADEADWQRCRQRIAPAALTYLEEHQDAFDLYDENGFLQLPNLEATNNAVLDKLDLGLSAGNNPTLFDHEASPDGRPQSPAWRALMLLTYQCFSTCGKIGVARWHGRWTTKDGRKPKRGPGSSEHAPCVDRSMLHTLIRGERLLDTVRMNMLTKTAIDALPNMNWGRPTWDPMPAGADDPRVHDLSSSYLGRLVPIARGVKLTRGSTRMTLVNGISYCKFPECREPCATVAVNRKEEHVYLKTDPSKHPWRELISVLAASSSTRSGALALEHLRHGDVNGHVDIWTGGLAADKGKILDVAEWNFHVPLALLDESVLRSYEEGVKLANTANERIAGAIIAYLGDLRVGEFTKNERGKFSRNDPRSRDRRARIIARATTWFWSRLDAEYSVLVETVNDPKRKLRDDWFAVVRSAMHRAYAHSCPHETPRQIRAYAKGDQRLRLGRPEG